MVKQKKTLSDILTYYEKAEEIKDPALQKRYIKTAKEIAKRSNIRIPTEIKKRFCKFCFASMKFAKTRILKSTISKTCPSCGKIFRTKIKKMKGKG